MYKILKKWNTGIYDPVDNKEFLVALLDTGGYVFLFRNGLDLTETYSSGETQKEHLVREKNSGQGRENKMQRAFDLINGNHLAAIWEAPGSVEQEALSANQMEIQLEEDCNNPYCTKKKGLNVPCWWCGTI